MYCACNGRIFNSLNKVRQEALFVESGIIVIILFCILNILYCMGNYPRILFYMLLFNVHRRNTSFLVYPSDNHIRYIARCVPYQAQGFRLETF
jgi:hypothetical protein